MAWISRFPAAEPFVTIADNVVLWSGNHIGHHSTIGANCFISSHVVVSGFCRIGEACFMGVNSTVSNNTNIESPNSHPKALMKERLKRVVNS